MITTLHRYHTNLAQHSERGALHLIGSALLFVIAAQSMLLYHWMHEVHAVEDELDMTSAQLERLQDRLDKLELQTTRLLIRSIGREARAREGTLKLQKTPIALAPARYSDQ